MLLKRGGALLPLDIHLTGELQRGNASTQVNLHLTQASGLELSPDASDLIANIASNLIATSCEYRKQLACNFHQSSSEEPRRSGRGGKEVAPNEAQFLEPSGSFA